MTRKRFVKMLMNHGLSRNQANYMAARCRRIGMPYLVGYVDISFGFCSRSMEEHWENMGWLKSEVEMEIGEQCRTFMEMCQALLSLAKNRKAS